MPRLGQRLLQMTSLPVRRWNNGNAHNAALWLGRLLDPVQHRDCLRAAEARRWVRLLITVLQRSEGGAGHAMLHLCRDAQYMGILVLQGQQGIGPCLQASRCYRC